MTDARLSGFKDGLYYIYFIHVDGEMMLYVRDDVEDETRWTPYHRVSSQNMPHLWKHRRAAENWIKATINALTMHVGEWKGIEHIHANPYGNPEATLKRLRKTQVN